MKETCKVLSSKLIYHGRVFDVVDDELIMPDGRKFARATIVHPGAVVIMPVLDDGSVLAIRQYRHPLRRTILEFPAGTLDKGEAPLDCARREICEETGYGAATWQDLGIVYPGPGICSEIQHLFVARDLRPEKLQGDEDEVIEVQRFSVTEIEEAIRSGELSDAKSIALFMRARLEGLI